jgi:hypothetical protein
MAGRFVPDFEGLAAFIYITRKSFRIRFYAECARNPFRIRFYEKQGGGVPILATCRGGWLRENPLAYSPDRSPSGFG